MDENGLEDWTLGWDNTKTIYGRCWFGKRKITLSNHFFSRVTEENNKDTLLHEAAHALAFIHDNHVDHGYAWQKWCVRLGAVPRRCGITTPAERATLNTAYKYHLIDSRNGRVIKRYHRRPRFVVSAVSLKGDLSSKGKLKLVQVK